MSRQKAGRSTFHNPSRAHEGMVLRSRQAFTTLFYAVLEFQIAIVPDLRFIDLGQFLLAVILSGGGVAW
jgi:hypothetical protein